MDFVNGNLTKQTITYRNSLPAGTLFRHPQGDKVFLRVDGNAHVSLTTGTIWRNIPDCEVVIVEGTLHFKDK